MYEMYEETSQSPDCYLQIDCDAIGRNLEALKGRTNASIIAVVKNDGYGLSLVEYSRLLTDLGIEALAVGSCDEALELRRNGIDKPVLLLTPQLSVESAGELLRKGIMLTVGSAAQAGVVRLAAENTGIQPKIHVKIDTGLGRYGFQMNEIDKVNDAVGGMDVRGIFTHFSSPYIDRKATRNQYELFLQAARSLREAGMNAEALHCCASGGFLNHPDMHLDAARIGSALIGRVPNAAAHGLASAVKLVAPVAAIKPPSGHRAGYRSSVSLGKSSRIGILSVGCSCALPPAQRAMGLFRSKQYASINGARAKVLGPLGIGALAVDLAGIPCHEGDLAELEINPLHCAGHVQRIFKSGLQAALKSMRDI